MEPTATTSMGANNNAMKSQEHNLTGKDVEEYLRRLSQDKVQDMSPAITFFVLLILAGIPGNTFVILVYWKCFKASSTRVFVLAMAVFDLVSSVLSLPLIIVEYCFFYNFPDFRFCKVMLAVQILPAAASSWLLVAVAWDRRRRICQPFKRQLNPRHASYAVILSLILSSVPTFPFLPLKGESHLATEFHGVFGRRCGYQEKYRHSTYPMIESVFLSLNIFVGVAAFLFCYFHIGLKMYTRKKNRPLSSLLVYVNRGEEMCTSAELSAENDTRNIENVCEVDTSDHKEHERKNEPNKVLTHDAEEIQVFLLHQKQLDESSTPQHTGPTRFSCLRFLAARCFLVFDDHSQTAVGGTTRLEESALRSEPPSPSSAPFSTEISSLDKETATPNAPGITEMSSKSHDGIAGEGTTQGCQDLAAGHSLQGTRFNRCQQRKTSSRATLMMFVLNLTVIVTFIPYIIVTVIYNGAFEHCPLMSGWAMNWCLIVATLPYVNIVTNPLIYSICNPNFRLKSLKFLKMIGARCTKSS